MATTDNTFEITLTDTLTGGETVLRVTPSTASMARLALLEGLEHDHVTDFYDEGTDDQARSVADAIGDLL